MPCLARSASKPAAAAWSRPPPAARWRCWEPGPLGRAARGQEVAAESQGFDGDQCKNNGDCRKGLFCNKSNNKNKGRCDYKKACGGKKNDACKNTGDCCNKFRCKNRKCKKKNN